MYSSLFQSDSPTQQALTKYAEQLRAKMSQLLQNPYESRDKAATQLIREFGLRECKPVQVDGKNKLANGKCLILKCKVCENFRITVRRSQSGGIFSWNVIPKESDLEHGNYLQNNGKNVFFGCDGKYQCSQVIILCTKNKS